MRLGSYGGRNCGARQEGLKAKPRAAARASIACPIASAEMSAARGFSAFHILTIKIRIHEKMIKTSGYFSTLPIWN